MSSNIPTSILGVIALLIAYQIIVSVRSWYRLRAFPGPWSASWCRIWAFRMHTNGKMGYTMRSAAEKYGRTFRIGPEDLLTADIEAIRRLGSARLSYRRSNFYSSARLDPYNDSMINIMDTVEHDKLKAKLAPGYSGKEVPGLEATIDSVVTELTNKIAEKYASSRNSWQTKQNESSKPLLDFGLMAQYFTLDIISQIAWGQKLGYLETESDVHGHLAMLAELLVVNNVAASIPFLASLISERWVQKLLSPSEKNPRGVFRILPLSRAVVAKRFAPDAESQQDMLGSFIRHGLSQAQCNAEAMVQLIAGSDTTATAIRATLLHIITAPRVYSTLQSEIDAAISSGRICSSTKIVTYAEALSLPYLQAVIYEGIRIWPPFTATPFKHVPEGGDTIDGKFVPAGTRIAPNTMAVMRDPVVFGSDVDEFRPERWLLEDGDRVAEMKRVVELVFGYGRWMCAGKHIAFLELNKVFVELLKRFDFQIANPTKPWNSVNYALWLQWDMWVRVTARED
ncbi:Pisatin demethylase [Echria macrotheca]|uniref:Cytochrome P450 monooxygenase ABA1 n=1 Tax=Echria macrotheca TaxID=438768 RepID=A0AAJ0BKU6_9PEZI|nr:Pisatin demethylase [Echria macrotheca]